MVCTKCISSTCILAQKEHSADRHFSSHLDLSWWHFMKRAVSTKYDGRIFFCFFPFRTKMMVSVVCVQFNFKENQSWSLGSLKWTERHHHFFTSNPLLDVKKIYIMVPWFTSIIHSLTKIIGQFIHVLNHLSPLKRIEMPLIHSTLPEHHLFCF